MPNTLLVSIPRTDYLSHACSQQAHNDSSHAAIFLLSIVKHPSWSIHRARVQSGDVWCGGKKTLSKPWSAKFPTAPGSPKQNGGRPFAVTSNLMILNPKNWLTQDPRSSKIIPKQKKTEVFLQQPTWVPMSQLQLFPCTTAAWVAAHEPARGTCLIACEFKCDGSQNCI